MRVKCRSVDDFIICLNNEQHVLSNIIRLDIFKNTVKQFKDEVIFSASAVVLTYSEVGEEYEYVLETTEHCGFDLTDQEPDLAGTKVSEKLYANLNLYCNQRKWKLLPGRIEV